MKVTAVLGSVVVIAAIACSAATPQSPEGPNLLRDAAAAYQSGDVAAAIRLYREFLKDHPDAAEIRSNLGAALVRDGQFAPAIDEYRKALAQLPKNPNVRLNLALAYYKLGRLPEAVHELEILHTQEPLEIKPALLLADCLLQIGDSRKTVQLLTPLEEEFPDDGALLYVLGAALLKENRTAEAKAILDRMRESASAESAYLAGQTEFQAQNPVAAAGHLARAVELNPKLPGVHSLYGQVLRAVGKLDAAAEQFREELAVNAFDFVANTEAAMLLKQEGKLDEALTHVTRALQVRPKDAGALYQRASIHMMQGSLEQARLEFEELTKEYPDFSEAHAGLATVYYRLKRTADGDRERAAARRVQEEAERRLQESRNDRTEPPVK